MYAAPSRAGHRTQHPLPPDQRERVVYSTEEPREVSPDDPDYYTPPEPRSHLPRGCAWEISAARADRWRDHGFGLLLSNPVFLSRLVRPTEHLLVELAMDLVMYKALRERWRAGRGPWPGSPHQYLRPGREHWGELAPYDRRLKLLQLWDEQLADLAEEEQELFDEVLDTWGDAQLEQEAGVGEGLGPLREYIRDQRRLSSICAYADPWLDEFLFAWERIHDTVHPEVLKPGVRRERPGGGV